MLVQVQVQDTILQVFFYKKDLKDMVSMQFMVLEKLQVANLTVSGSVKPPF